MVGQPAPTLAGKTIDGQSISLAELRGQVVLVNAWATWCKPCIAELPELAKLHRERAPQGFSVLGVNTDRRQHLMKVREEALRFELGYPNLFDPETQALRPWKVVGYPTSILVGRDGTIRWRRDGMIQPGDAELARQIDDALAQPAS
jgi:cytochrome c biogenesis protein CcmG, thiol:disulfide interchange protein DsbE